MSIFYLTNIIIATCLFKKNHSKISHLQFKGQDLQEQINILTKQNALGLKNKNALQDKIKRYNSLKTIIEEINQSLTLESIANRLAEISFSQIAKNKGQCLFYLVDNESQRLNLFKTKKEDEKLIIKSKEGDIFDLWVIRHASPLLVEDIRKDFRFDLDRLKTDGFVRPVSSLISCPFISEHKFLGILRLDNPNASFFSQEDLRFLTTICDIAAVAIENGELFQKTQDLAIHDELTSLYTKGYFIDRLKEELKRSIRQKRPLSLLMLDIDYFKNYNDKFGHTAGDIVLKTLSDNIVKSLDDLNPIISRFGGEEFCIILSGIDKKKAKDTAESLRKDLEKIKIILRRIETSVTVSIGVATFPQDANEQDELVLKADLRMYEAKQRGRNRVCTI